VQRATDAIFNKTCEVTRRNYTAKPAATAGGFRRATGKNAGRSVARHVIVATDNNDAPVAVSMYTVKPELLSGDISAHLEVLAVDKNHMRQGLGKKLIDATTTAAIELGATVMSLHVFSNNKRARALYKSCGFDEELIRCYKPLTVST